VKPNWKKDFGKITFLDSYLLLTSSLSKLSKKIFHWPADAGCESK
jgi:hypothetical protein